MNNRFISFDHISKLIHRSNFTADTRSLVAERFADTLTLQYPDFSRDKFVVACLTGVGPVRKPRKLAPLKVRGNLLGAAA